MSRLRARLQELRSGNGRSAAPARGELWALDLETTGLDARRDRIIAVGMVPIVEGVIRRGGAYASLVRPSLAAASADPAANGAAGGGIAPRLTGEQLASIQAHHLRPSDVAQAPPLNDVLPEVLRRLADADGLVVHHAGLDVAVLRHACTSLGRRWPAPAVIDTIRLIDKLRRRWRVAGVKVPYDLGGARAALGLPPHDAHDALADAVATAELYLALTARL